MIYRLVCLIFLLFLAEELFSQSREDSLSKKSLSELLNLFENSSDNLNKQYYIEAFIKRSKQKLDTSSIAEGYNHLALMYQQDTLGLHYADSIIQLTKNNPTSLYPANGFMLKGDQYFFLQGNLKKALDNYLMAGDFAENSFNKETKFGSNHMIGLIKDKIGYSKEALQIHTDNLQFIEEKFEPPVKSIFSGTSLQALAFTYKNLGKLDSALHYNNRGMLIAQKINHISLINHLLLNEGVIYYHKSEFQKSQKSLKKSLEYFEKIKDKANMAESYFYLAKNYDKQGDTERSIRYLKRVDSIFIDTRTLSPDIRESYEMLINYYKRREDPNTQLVYLKRLISLDSLLSSDKSYLSKHLKDSYDIPKLMKRKEVLISELEKDHQYLKYIFIVIGIAFTFIVILFYNRQKKYKKKFEKIINNNVASQKNELPEQESFQKKKVDNLEVPENLSQEILVQLKSFIAQEKFKDNKLTLSSLAKFCGTNSTYLSKTINHYYNKSYTNYINDLRIDYAIEKLKIDNSFRKFTIKAIAQESGFKSAETFSKIFKKNSGIYPSYFIKQINNLNNK